MVYVLDYRKFTNPQPNKTNNLEHQTHVETIQHFIPLTIS